MNKQVGELKPEAEVATGPHVFQAIRDVMADLGVDGIQKNREPATGNKFKFRGIDDVLNALSPILSSRNLVILPRMLGRDCQERSSSNGGRLVYTTVEAEFSLVSSVDGSRVDVRTFGEAMDTGDKSTNKAMSAAYKYMAIQTFCIPTEGDNDPDSTVHQVASAEEQAVNLLRGASADKATFKKAWETNKDKWKGFLGPAGYARVTAEMKRLAAAFPKDEPKAAPASPAPERPPLGQTARAASPQGDPQHSAEAKPDTELVLNDEIPF